jgi:hypothetical protein
VTSKNYQSKCARLVQEAASVKYTKALEWVRFHEAAHPEAMPAETRALRIVEAHDGGPGLEP